MMDGIIHNLARKQQKHSRELSPSLLWQGRGQALRNKIVGKSTVENKEVNSIKPLPKGILRTPTVRFSEDLGMPPAAEPPHGLVLPVRSAQTEVPPSTPYGVLQPLPSFDTSHAALHLPTTPPP